MMICAAGDIYGAMDRFYEDVFAFEQALAIKFDWVLHVGDFGVSPAPERVDRATRVHAVRRTARLRPLPPIDAQDRCRAINSCRVAFAVFWTGTDLVDAKIVIGRLIQENKLVSPTISDTHIGPLAALEEILRNAERAEVSSLRVGGQKTRHRKRGIATMLMQEQHRQLKDLGFSRVETKETQAAMFLKVKTSN